MKFSNVIYDVLYEEVANKKLFSAILSKWREQNPRLSAEDAEALWVRFSQIRNGLRPDIPQVFTFLRRFDGENGEKFDNENPNNIKDITKYSYEQMLFLTNEYKKPEENNNTDITGEPTNEKIERSRNMWFDESNAFLVEGDVIVHNPKNEAESVSLGYFAEMVNTEQKSAGRSGNSIWCTTWRPDQHRTNMWGNYRDRRTFYYVLDKSRDLKSDKYALSSLQRVSPSDSTTGFRLTSLLNDGDNTMSWDEIIGIYPSLAEHRDKFKMLEFSPSELRTKSIINQINERPGRYNFSVQTREIKREYINNGMYLSKVESWLSLPDDLRRLYIQVTEYGQIMDRFGNYEFVQEIAKVGNMKSLLTNRLKSIGYTNGWSDLMAALLKEFLTVRVNISNPDIRIVQSKQGGSIGIMDFSTGEWYSKNGITYEPLYREIDVDALFDSEGNSYYVEVFGINGTKDEKTFYCAYDTDHPEVKGYFFSNQAWENLKTKHNLTNGDVNQSDDIDPDEIDIDRASDSHDLNELN